MKEKVEKIDAWVYKADQDLGAAKLVFFHLPDYSDTIAFHCQQAVEKYIKACLIYNCIEFQKSHDLVYLLDVLSQKIMIPEMLFSKAVRLNGFSVEVRYPDLITKFSVSELEEIIKIAEEFRSFVVSLIGI